MPQPDSTRSPWVDRWSDSTRWPPDPEAPLRPKRRRQRRCRDHVEDGRHAADPDGNEEQQRQRREAEAPSSRAPASMADSTGWVAAMPFTSEELEDTWPNATGRNFFDEEDDR